MDKVKKQISCEIETSCSLEEMRFLAGTDWSELKPQFSKHDSEVLFSLLQKGFIREHRGEELILDITEVGKSILAKIGL